MRIPNLLTKKIGPSVAVDEACSYLFITLIALSIIFPIAYAFLYLKAALIGLIAILSLFSMTLSAKRISIPLYMISLFFSFTGMAWSLFGIVRNNPGATRVMPVMVLCPLLYPLCLLFYRHSDNLSIHRILVACGWIIGVTDIFYVLNNATGVGALLNRLYTTLYPDWAVVDLNNYYLKFSLPSTVSIIFILPFVLSALLFTRQTAARLQYLLLTLLLIAVGVMSGRRGLIVSALLGPLLAYVVTLTPRRRGRKASGSRYLISFSVLLLVAVAVYSVVSLVGKDYYVDQLKSITDFSTNSSNLARYYQFRSLIAGISENPLTGAGGGAAADYVRSHDMPWTYELFYVAFVFHYGIVLSCVYLFAMLYLISYLVHHARMYGRSTFEYYFLSGCVGFLIANATNPILDTIDYMWIIFVPLAMINSKASLRGAFSLDYRVDTADDGSVPSGSTTRRQKLDILNSYRC